MNKIFYCYSIPLKDFLLESGLMYFYSELHNKTKKRFWVFDRTEELNNLLTVWRIRGKPK